jgi:hypothetical protein
MNEEMKFRYIFCVGLVERGSSFCKQIDYLVKRVSGNQISKKAVYWNAQDFVKKYKKT